MKELIKALSDMRGISGSEYRLTDSIADLFRPYADEVYIDTLGSVVAVKKCGIKDAPKVMIEAHCDEIGFMVKDIDERGFVSFVNIGGVDQRILPSAEVVIHGTRDLCGVIGAKPPHLQQAGERDKAIKLKDLAVDCGMTREEITEIVSIGDSITLSQSCGELLDGQISAKTLDDRAGVAAIITTLKDLSKFKLSADIYAVAAVQEEVGGRGAETTVYKINPNIAIAVDVTHGITPDNSRDAFECGSGAAIATGPNIHPRLFKCLRDTAKRYGIKHEIEVCGGDTGTDAWVMQTARCGVPTALLSIPLKYMHTSVETAAVSDIRAVSDIMTFFIENTDLEEWL